MIMLFFFYLSNHLGEERKCYHSSPFADEEAVAREGYLFKTEQRVSGRILNRIKDLGGSLTSFPLGWLVCCFVFDYLLLTSIWYTFLCHF